MLGRALFAALLALCGGAALASGAPPAAADPERAVAAKVQTACSGCHELTLLEGKHYAPDKWAEVTDQMISRGAQVDDADYDAVVAYLARHYGPEGK